MSNANTEIKTAIDAFALDQARSLLREALPTADAETYYLASQVSLNDDQKRDFLQKAIEKDPFHVAAHSALTAMKSTTATSATVTTTAETQSSALEVVPTPTTSAATVIEREQPLTAVAEVSLEQFVTGRIKVQCDVLRYPWPGSPTRTTAQQGGEVILLGRTESGNLFNVLYIGSTGSEILGWVNATKIMDFAIGTKPINPTDLPITNFEYNSRQEIEELLTRVAVCSVPFVPSLGKAFMVSPGTKWARVWTFFGIATVYPLIGLPSLIGGIYWWQKSKEHRETLLLNLGAGTIAEWYSRLKAAIDSKKSTTELAMEQQAKMAALQIATSLGGTVLSRVIPNNQNIRIRNR